jgi:hypothetical protein
MICELVDDAIQHTRWDRRRLIQQARKDYSEMFDDVFAHVRSTISVVFPASKQAHLTIWTNPSKKPVTSSSPPGTSHAKTILLMVAKLSSK